MAKLFFDAGVRRNLLVLFVFGRSLRFWIFGDLFVSLILLLFLDVLRVGCMYLFDFVRYLLSVLFLFREGDILLSLVLSWYNVSYPNTTLNSDHTNCYFSADSFFLTCYSLQTSKCYYHRSTNFGTTWAFEVNSTCYSHVFGCKYYICLFFLFIFPLIKYLTQNTSINTTIEATIIYKIKNRLLQMTFTT